MTYSVYLYNDAQKKAFYYGEKLCLEGRNPHLSRKILTFEQIICIHDFQIYTV